MVQTVKLRLTKPVIEELKRKFIAFDTETTGLSPLTDRIVELGAIKYVNGQKDGKFSSLVNPRKLIPASVSAINNITNEMLLEAPFEEDIYPELISYLAEAMEGNTIIVGHNAKFDMNFLSNTLNRLGYSGILYYVDTLSIARSRVFDVDNYKQETLARYFEISNPQAHRAYTDADTCAQILIRLIE